jgi:hypothetical protein
MEKLHPRARTILDMALVFAFLIATRGRFRSGLEKQAARRSGARQGGQIRRLARCATGRTRHLAVHDKAIVR